MNIESKKVSINKSKDEIISFLTNIPNYEKLMPDDTRFEVLGDDIFLFALKGMPEIKLKLQEQADDKVILGAASDKLPFTLTANLNEIEAGKTEAQLSFEGQFNPMMAMMVKGPITKFVGQLTDKLEAINK